MTIRLEIDVFSGRPNPSVDLDDREASALLERMAPSRRIADDIPEPPPILGYRGIVVEQRDRISDDLPGRFRVANGMVFGHGLAHETSDPEVEDFVLEPDGPFRRVEREIAVLAERIEPQRVILRELPWVRERFPWDERIIDVFVPPCPCGPVYEPGWWNVPSIQPHNNCYNYATNYRTDTFAQPGKAAGSMYSDLQCAAVRPAAMADQLIDAPNADNQCPTGGHLVALVVAPDWDFHWYRKGADGWWTHKPGGTAATRLDNDGKFISDPRNAARGPYTDFCTFMIVKHGHIKII